MSPIESIKGFLSSIFNGIGDLLDYLNPTSENFFLKLFFENLFNLLDVLNPFSENFILKLLIEELTEFFKFLFIPSFDCFSDLYNNFILKFGFITDIKNVLNEFFAYSDYGGEEYPVFNINYAGVTVSIIDFSAFAPYRQFFHSILIFICWISFLLRTYKKIPNLINGENGGVE